MIVRSRFLLMTLSNTWPSTWPVLYNHELIQLFYSHREKLQYIKPHCCDLIYTSAVRSTTCTLTESNWNFTTFYSLFFWKKKTDCSFTVCSFIFFFFWLPNFTFQAGHIALVSIKIANLKIQSKQHYLSVHFLYRLPYTGWQELRTESEDTVIGVQSPRRVQLHTFAYNRQFSNANQHILAHVFGLGGSRRTQRKPLKGGYREYMQTRHTGQRRKSNSHSWRCEANMQSTVCVRVCEWEKKAAWNVDHKNELLLYVYVTCT